MYEIKLQIYKVIHTTFKVSTWEEAYKIYSEISNSLPKNWTRHNSVNGEISHFDNRFNLFNEGSLKLEKVETKTP